MPNPREPCPLLPSPRRCWLRRSYRPRRVHAPRLGRDPRLVTDEEYREGLALAQLSPGPLAAELCFYLGYLRGGVLGAALCGLAFVLPSFVIVVALGWAYVHYRGLTWMQSVFYGVGAAVIGIISRSAYGLARKTIGKDFLLWGIFLVVAVATAVTGREIVPLILAAGALVWLVRSPP